MPNYNPVTGIPYGFIEIQHLQGWVIEKVLDLEPEEALEACEEYIKERLEMRSPEDDPKEVEEEARDEFWAGLDEMDFLAKGAIEGVEVLRTKYDGVVHIFVTESPFIGTYLRCFPDIPGAGDLDCPNPDGMKCYDVPADWRYVSD